MTSVADRATPNLPSRDLDATAAFYGRLGFNVTFQDKGWLILERGQLQPEFFPHVEIDPLTTIASCCLRIADVDALHEAFTAVGLPNVGRLRASPALLITPGEFASAPWLIRTAICCAA